MDGHITGDADDESVQDVGTAAAAVPNKPGMAHQPEKLHPSRRISNLRRRWRNGTHLRSITSSGQHQMPAWSVLFERPHRGKTRLQNYSTSCAEAFVNSCKAPIIPTGRQDCRLALGILTACRYGSVNTPIFKLIESYCPTALRTVAVSKSNVSASFNTASLPAEHSRWNTNEVISSSPMNRKRVELPCSTSEQAELMSTSSNNPKVRRTQSPSVDDIFTLQKFPLTKRQDASPVPSTPRLTDVNSSIDDKTPNVRTTTPNAKQHVTDPEQSTDKASKKPPNPTADSVPTTPTTPTTKKEAVRHSSSSVPTTASSLAVLPAASQLPKTIPTESPSSSKPTTNLPEKNSTGITASRTAPNITAPLAHDALFSSPTSLSASSKPSNPPQKPPFNIPKNTSIPQTSKTPEALNSKDTHSQLAKIGIGLGCVVAVLAFVIGIVIFKIQVSKKRAISYKNRTKFNDFFVSQNGANRADKTKRDSIFPLPPRMRTRQNSHNSGSGHVITRPESARGYPPVIPPFRVSTPVGRAPTPLSIQPYIQPPLRPPRSPPRENMMHQPTAYYNSQPDSRIVRNLTTNTHATFSTNRGRSKGDDAYRLERSDFGDDLAYLDSYYSESSTYESSYAPSHIHGIDLMQPDDRPYDRSYNVDRNGRLNVFPNPDTIYRNSQYFNQSTEANGITARRYDGAYG
ncbi:hypothetical protein O181_053634 [Austropuccinia psidii MF-1]|uniref:Uncharacterized protein n=1 Tax=Austropuccinia psidii MF-1 TaxID=1389203 RepID=A0A9Q3E317_9BASI|nr:hypothetical protein [Austropuccinia psidii MF-1]